MLTMSADLVTALRRALGPQWLFERHGSHLAIRHKARGSPYRPPRHAMAWTDMLGHLQAVFGSYGIPRARPLPVRWNLETDFTVSAIQALDPYLKRRQRYTYREGYLPQPVVRFTGKRDSTGRLADGFLTAFVNVSCVLPVHAAAEHASILDTWLTALSRLGLHARHIGIRGDTTPWQRREVEGITLHIRHLDLPIGDLVLLWNTEDPSFIATDLGSGLERLRWAITRTAWPEVVHGPLASRADPAALDAIRAATLMAGSGIRPADHGPGSALRRLTRSVPASAAGLGLSNAVRHAYDYWSLTTRMELPWPEICQILDNEALRVPRGA